MPPGDLLSCLGNLIHPQAQLITLRRRLWKDPERAFGAQQQLGARRNPTASLERSRAPHPGRAKVRFPGLQPSERFWRSRVPPLAFQIMGITRMPPPGLCPWITSRACPQSLVGPLPGKYPGLHRKSPKTSDKAQKCSGRASTARPKCTRAFREGVKGRTKWPLGAY